MTIAGIAVFLLLAQNATPQQPAPPAAPASIEGTVAKAVTGESLSKVTVTLTEVRSPTALAPDIPFAVAPNSPEYALVVASLNQRNTGPPQVVTTAYDGRFLFENVKPGTYTIKATLGGYAPAEYGQRGPNGRGMNITLKAGQKIQGISLTMTPGGTILGRVTDANGEPLIRAMIQAQKLIYKERGRSLVTVEAVYTDDRGDYRLFWLPAGQYYINATPSDDRMRTMTAMLPSPNGATTTVSPLTSNTVLSAVRDMGTGLIYGIPSGLKVNGQSLSNGEVIEEAAVPVFYPAASDPSTATSVEVRPGAIIGGIDITTKPARVYRIRGRVISSSGRPVSAADITLVPKNSQAAAQSSHVPQSPNNAGFEIAGVLPGSYHLLVTGSEAPGMPVVGLASVDVQASSLENVIITASPPFAIQGHLSRGSTISTAAPLQSYTIRMEPQLPGLPDAVVLGTNLLVRQDNFTLPISVATDYRVTVASPPNTYVQSIRFGGQDVLSNGLHIDGATGETLEIVVSPSAGRLEGNVSLDRQKFANATVVVVPSSSFRQQTSLYQTTQTNSEGHFTFENIPPGSYKVFAWEDVEPLAWFDAEFMRSIESRGTEVLIRESAKENIEISLIPR